MALEALIFDVDGTLADTERDGHRVAFNAAFRDAGLNWDWTVPLYGELLSITGGKERIRYYLDNFNHEFTRPANLDGFIADLHKSKTRHYTRMLDEGGIPLRTGVKRLLQEAQQSGLRMAIATTTTPENVSALLQSTLGVEGERYFEFIAAGDIVPAKKPAPDIYGYALQQMQLTPQQCIALEDSANGLRAARGAQLLTLITVNDYTAQQDFRDAALVLDHLGELQQPFTVQQGHTGRHRIVDVALLKELHQQQF